MKLRELKKPNHLIFLMTTMPVSRTRVITTKRITLLWMIPKKVEARRLWRVHVITTQQKRVH